MGSSTTGLGAAPMTPGAHVAPSRPPGMYLEGPPAKRMSSRHQAPASGSPFSAAADPEPGVHARLRGGLNQRAMVVMDGSAAEDDGATEASEQARGHFDSTPEARCLPFTLETLRARS